MRFTESQFQTILCHSMISYWTSVEVNNGFNVNGRQLFPLAREYAPKEGHVNDWFSAWGRGIDLLLLDSAGKISLVEMKEKSASRTATLRQIAQAYEGAYYLRKTPPREMISMFEESFRVMFGAIEGRGRKIFENETNTLFAVHKRFFKLDSELTLDDFPTLLPSELILSLNPGASFPEGTNSLKGMSAQDVLDELKALPGADDKKCFERLKQVFDEDLKIPLTFLEFRLSLSAVAL